jgi:hypothetical protein
MTSADDAVSKRRALVLRRVALPGALVALLFALLWFPFDWLSTVWPAFGIPFRQVFRNARDHFVGHSVFFFSVGFLTLALIPALRRKPQWYFPGLVVAALIQETIQALFRRQVPTFTDVNAFKGDALGGVSAFALWALIGLFQRATKRAQQRHEGNMTADANSRN